jgi:hypothetical protein
MPFFVRAILLILRAVPLSVVHKNIMFNNNEQYINMNKSDGGEEVICMNEDNLGAIREG